MLNDNVYFNLMLFNLIQEAGYLNNNINNNLWLERVRGCVKKDACGRFVRYNNNFGS